jgi:hypothetical protein
MAETMTTTIFTHNFGTRPWVFAPFLKDSSKTEKAKLPKFGASSCQTPRTWTAQLGSKKSWNHGALVGWALILLELLDFV